MIIDFHAHAFPEAVAPKADAFLTSYYNLRLYGDGTLAQLLKQERDAGITRTVVSSTATNARQVRHINDWISAAAQQHAEVIPFGSLHPDYPDTEAEVERMISLGIRGVKLHPDFQQRDLLCPGMRRIFAACEGKLPVLVHVGDKNTQFSKPEKMARIADMYPGCTIIAAHMGGYTEWEQAEKWLIGSRVYVDTSSTLWAVSPEKMAQLIRRHGAERVLFGTDYPLTGAADELAAFARVALDPTERELILHLNAEKLLGIYPGAIL